MKEQCCVSGLFFCVEIELCLPWYKNSGETFQGQSKAHWQFNPFINGSLLKTVLPQLRFLAPPRGQMKTNTVALKLS